MAKSKIGNSVRLMHLMAATFLLLYAVLQAEAGATPWFFGLCGLAALLISLSQSSFLSRPSTDALILWFEAVCFMLAAFRSFNSGKSVIPWLLLLAAIIYAVKGYQRSGIK
jgi:hypothetical protein